MPVYDPPYPGASRCVTCCPQNARGAHCDCSPCGKCRGDWRYKQLAAIDAPEKHAELAEHKRDVEAAREAVGVSGVELEEGKVTGTRIYQDMVRVSLEEFNAAGGHLTLAELNAGGPVPLGKVVGIFDTGKDWASHPPPPSSAEKPIPTTTTGRSSHLFRYDGIGSISGILTDCNKLNDSELIDYAKLLDDSAALERYSEICNDCGRNWTSGIGEHQWCPNCRPDQPRTLESRIRDVSYWPGHDFVWHADRRRWVHVAGTAMIELAEIDALARALDARPGERLSVAAKRLRASYDKQTTQYAGHDRHHESMLGDKCGILAGRLKRQLLRNALLRERLNELEGK